MAKRWVERLPIICLLLFIIANNAVAEVYELAFGYEIELPEGVAITKEVWTPENMDMMYLLEGTYADGKEVFELVWCDASERPSHNASDRIIDRVNIMTDMLWGSLMGSTNVGGDYEGAIHEMVFQQMIDFSKEIERNLLADMKDNQGLDTRIFKKLRVKDLDTDIDFEESTVEIQSHMRASYHDGKLVVEDEKGQTLLWMRKLPNLKIRARQDGLDSEEEQFNEMYLSIPGALESIGLSIENYDDSKEVLRNHAWKGDYSEYCVMIPQKDRNGFVVLKVFRDGVQIVVDEGKGDWEEALAMAHSAIIFYRDDYEERNLFPSGYYTSDVDGVMVTVPVAEGRYLVSVEDRIREVPFEKREYLESAYDGGVKTAYGYINKYGLFSEILVYQYLPMPEEFCIDTLNISNEEYLMLLEDAFEYLGNKYKSILDELAILKTHQNLTADVIETEGARILEMLSQATESSQMSLNVISDYLNAKKVDVVTKYFTPIDWNEIEKEYCAWNAGGKRWIRTDSFDLFGENSINGYGAIALFDGALHLIEAADYINVSYTLARNYGNILEVIVQENEDIMKAKLEGKRIATIATKTSPLTMRKTPDKEGEKIQTIPKGESVIVIQEGEWPLIEYRGKQGYVDGKYLD